MDSFNSNQELFWKTRSKGYDKLEWVNHIGYMNEILHAGDFKSDHIVLDVGTGTGTVLHHVAPHVREIIGLDISQDMLKHSNWQGNKYFIRRDIREPIFKEAVFDRVIARMVFHHIVEDTQKAVNECYKVLKYEGKFILSEGVPPCREVKSEYTEIFKLKEKRLIFMPQDLKQLLADAGFKNIEIYIYKMSGVSVSNWLEKSGLSKSVQQRIFDMHIYARDYFKKVYNMKIVDNDCLIDMKYITAVGSKIE